MHSLDFLIGQGEQLFGKRSGLLSLWQNIADNFFPERASFTTVRNIGEDFGANLMSSYPVLARRDLGNAMSAMLRPTSKQWKSLRTKNNWEKLGTGGRAWLEWANNRMTRAMYHRTSQFSRATKAADHDFAAFGQAAMQITLNHTGNGLLYRTWHLRDVAWAEDADGAVCTVYRKWKPTLIELSRTFPGKLHPEMQKRLDKEPYAEVDVWHCIIPSDVYDFGSPDKKARTRYVSVYLDVQNRHSLETIGVKRMEYVIPRWALFESQYAYSPATVVALPDARLLQDMTRTLLEAGEKAVNPPMLIAEDMIRSDISIYAGGVTTYDADYDERTGTVLRPIEQDLRGIPLGLDMARDLRAMLTEAFFLNKLSMPQPGVEMTAFEVGHRVQEYIRQALPLFEPLESEYNAPVCELTFDIMLDAGALGSPFSLPDELQGEGVEFSFESPLHEAIEREKGQRFLEAGSMLAQALQLDPGSRHVVDIRTAFRDVLQGIGVPASWTRSLGEVDKLVAADEQQQQTAQLLAGLQQGADVAKTLKEATPEGGAALTPVASLQ